MPIHLITGKPGAGKTLCAVKLLVEEHVPTGRPVYAYIDGLAYEELGVKRLVPEEDELNDAKRISALRTWHNVEEGAIVFIDECQHCFPPRNGASAVPPYIRHFETHRHYGQDIVLITQGPKLIDRHLHDLIDQHWHVFRAFGLKTSVIRKWQGVNPEPEPSQNESNVAKDRFVFPKKYFRLYKSATVHTVQARLPWGKLGIALGAFLMAVAGFALTFRSLTTRSVDGSAEIAASIDAGQSPAVLCELWVVRLSSNVLHVVDAQNRLQRVPLTDIEFSDEHTFHQGQLLCYRS